MRLRVVCGLSETMASLTPTMRVSSVDLPALGRPTNETSPTRTSGLACGKRRPPLQPDLVDAPALGLEHLHAQVAHVECLALGGHPAEVREQEPPDGLEA